MSATTIFAVPVSFALTTQEPKGTADSPVAPGPLPGQTGAPQGGAGGGAPASGCADPTMLLPMGLFLALMYFMVLRPEQKRRKETMAMLASIKQGDKVVTNGGMHGQIHRLDEHTVTLLVDDVKMTFDRAAIARVLRDGASADGKKS